MRKTVIQLNLSGSLLSQNYNARGIIVSVETDQKLQK